MTSLTYIGSNANTYPYKGVMYRTVDLAFEVKISNPDGIKAGDDVETVVWVPISEIDVDKFAFESMRALLGKWLPKRHDKLSSPVILAGRSSASAGDRDDSSDSTNDILRGSNKDDQAHSIGDPKRQCDLSHSSGNCSIQ